MARKLNWNTEKLTKTMVVGERLIWGTHIQTVTPKDLEPVNIGWIDRDVYFTNQRILWDVDKTIPEQIPYEAISKLGKSAPRSGGLAAMAAFGSGGVIDVISTYATIGLQFQNRESLDFGNWLLNEAMSGRELKPVEGTPSVVGEKDPNAPPPAPKSSGGCFIATATYGSPFSPEVFVFRRFRDEVLLSSMPGSLFVKVYYRVSPPLASLIAKAPWLKSATRCLLLGPILSLLKRTERNQD